MDRGVWFFGDMSVGCLTYAIVLRHDNFLVKQETAYEVRISDWSSDVCSSDRGGIGVREVVEQDAERPAVADDVVQMDGQHMVLAQPVQFCPEQQIGRASCRERVCKYV